ncbi:M23 family metallopeptidase [Rhizobium sp. TRM96647]|uniref:M23 family metallopeptidase n=1 Tax=unclassified Rhizobium TaxID=2613769 RepID=UPI001E572273|nr:MULTISPECIES: M23 family metallopeptidase [unclassified Rhizobium]MCD2182238.1 M23 family metallopeptidase [Rhizobium sp. GN54]MCV3734568.1 M23 family metallopeptidase [Rhizobium sp. TRM96647]MCV3756938.1 M23 family metallopeptidase [Rhizobium sp. TRM96650]
MIRTLGNEPPLVADGRRAPDRREISLRWLSGTFLTGITSSILMGVALFAALDGRQQLAIPAEAYAALEPQDHPPHPENTVKRGQRILEPNVVAKPADKKIMDVSTMIHDGEKEVVRRKPFAHVTMALAASHTSGDDYPPFDPLAIFSDGDKDDQPVSRTGTIYGSEVESEVALKSGAFPTGGSALAFADQMSADEVEENVRTNGSALTDGSTQIASLYYVDPQRFASDTGDLDLLQGLTARVVEENMSVSDFDTRSADDPEYADDVIPVRRAQDIVGVMTGAGYTKAQAEDLSTYLKGVLDGDELAQGDVLRICVMQRGKQADIVRASVYSGGRHVTTVALDDKGRFIPGMEPPPLAAVATAFDGENRQVMASGRDMPRVYDGIYRAALSYGMSKDMTAQVVRILASNVDFQAQLRPNDTLEAFFSVADDTGVASEDSELLFLDARFGDTETRVYRFQDPDDDSIDYYDQDGKSIRQFLLRNPVPNGRFRSGFGMRRHPILGFSRMHTGVDWSAPRGTPIIAAGNGTVEKAGWDSGGYGNQTLIRHANGYVSSYNHQSAIAKGIKPGVKVRQGQVIGFVGTTGLSTGPHLHYELIVNGNKVDALKIRLPGGKSLDGEALAQFQLERKRIDDLLGREDDASEVAAKR